MYSRQCKLLNYLEPRLSYNQGKVLGIAKWRKEILAGDKNICQNCFNVTKDIYRNRKPKNEAHHIIARVHVGKNTLNNGITLCTFCHDYFDYMMKMEFKIGEPMFLCGNWKNVRNIMFDLSVRMQNRFRKVLFIDTLNAINPHHKAYAGNLETHYFKNIYCVRTEKPYDLLARLNTTDNFIISKGIGTLLINSLNLLFIDSNNDEIVPVLNNILDRIYYLTKKHKLLTAVGSSPHNNEKAMLVACILLCKRNVVMLN